MSYGVLSIVLILVLAIVSLTARTPPPPSIAEFAPQAVENISDAPSDQSSRRGASAGFTESDFADDAGASAKPVAPINVARVRRCVGDPPRQIEDPQSPPCVPYWEGDNGGATTKGVTRDSIRIGLSGNGNTPAGVPEALAQFFNSRFEFYGRKLVGFPAGSGQTCDQKRASAIYVAEEVKGFAASDPSSGSATCYYDELAKRRVIATTVEPHLNEAYLTSRHPYVWSYTMPEETLFHHLGRWTCRRLADQKARFSPDPLIQVKDRKFGIIMHTTTQVTGFDVRPLQQELSACGQTDVPVASYNHDHSADTTAPQGQSVYDPTLATNAIVKMKSEGVTSVICLCIVFVEQYVPSAANSQQYFPEWLMSSWFGNDVAVNIKAFWPSPEQRRAMIGVAMRPREVPYDQAPIVWAMREMQPGYSFTTLQINNALTPYRSLLMIASGIQMAGPRLTPETFARGLQSTRFPNPDHPIKAGKVGFSGTTPDHGMTEDVTEFSWSENDPSPYADEGNGRLCYTDGGARHTSNDWPRGDAGLLPAICPPGG